MAITWCEALALRRGWAETQGWASPLETEGGGPASGPKMKRLLACNPSHMDPPKRSTLHRNHRISLAGLFCSWGVCEARCGETQQVVRKLRPVPRVDLRPKTGALPNFSNFCSGAPPLTYSGVQIGPGANPLTRMPFDTSRLASDLT
jgi:hypothetical protein